MPRERLGMKISLGRGKRKKNSTENKNTKRSRKLRKSESELCVNERCPRIFSIIFFFAPTISYSFQKAHLVPGRFTAPTSFSRALSFRWEKTQRIRSAPKRRVKKKSEEKTYKKTNFRRKEPVFEQFLFEV